MQQLKILFLPAWYPSEHSPLAGIFVKEHAKAASLYHDIIVLYAYSAPIPSPGGIFQISESVEDNIRTIRVRYGGLIPHLRNLLFQRRSGSARGPAIDKRPSFLGKIFALTRLIALYFGIATGFYRLLRKGWRPDIIHAHICMAGVPAVILGKIYRIPVIFTEHWSGFLLKTLTLFDRIRVRFAMNRADAILPVSDSLRKQIEDYGVKNRFWVVPNVVDTKVYYPLLNREKKGNETKSILTVALLTPVKGVTYLLKALNHVKGARKDFILDIIGEGPSREECEKLSAELGLNDIVRFHGIKPKEEVAKFMRDCDFFVLPSLVETFGVVLIEALASGKPVVTTNIGGPGEIINEEVGRLVPPKDEKALAEAIDYMLDHSRDYFPEHIAQYARGRFGYEAVGKMMDGIYRKVKLKSYEG